jgi:hypothetical protein
MSANGNFPAKSVRPARLWFGLSASAVAWILLGCLDIFITFAACTHQDQFGVPGDHPGVAEICLALAILLLAVTVAAGVTSYRNWRALSQRAHIIETQAVDRGEFMALLGVIVSVTLGMGIVWLALPPLFIDLCWRAK